MATIAPKNEPKPVYLNGKLVGFVFKSDGEWHAMPDYWANDPQYANSSVKFNTEKEAEFELMIHSTSKEGTGILVAQ